VGDLVRATDGDLRTGHLGHRGSADYDYGMSIFNILSTVSDEHQPPFTLVFVILCGLAFLISRKRLSPWVAGLGVEIVQIICYILLITVKQPIAKYIFVMIATAASQSFFGVIWPERIRAARGTTTAGLAIGMTNAGGQLMGIVGPQIYQAKFGPTYHVSYFCSIALLTTCLGAVLTSWFFVAKADKQTLEPEIEDLESVA
jgi:nitrate/nitrite transporter NarK